MINSSPNNSQPIHHLLQRLDQFRPRRLHSFLQFHQITILFFNKARMPGRT
ncbi:hypothetical protein HanXRQr2_Chr14g0650021 [Helianthus annuus]|uniref:Uncharacterized protein n=1 Tax=Helianthus annuus TaxID=4232 RepID=A0A9K3H842_HELAN|nr:hypothetical protein HanXRQr2_Chr14g0650021 [Helianthus annuus]